MLLQWTKKLTRERQDVVFEALNGTSESFPTELSLITEEKRLIKVAGLHLQWYHMEGEGIFFRIFISILGSARFEDGSLSLLTL